MPSLEQLAASLAEASVELDNSQVYYSAAVIRQQTAEDRVAELVAQIAKEAEGQANP